MTSFGLPSGPSRRRAEEFARLLDGGPVTADASLGQLAQLAGALRALPLGPTPDFRSTLRQRLVAVATVQGVGPVAAGSATNSATAPMAVGPVTARPAIAGVGARVTDWAEGWRVRRKFMAATASVAAVVLLGGIGLAGSRSLPGDPFYGVKRGIEDLQLATARSSEAKGVKHLQFAQTRLREVNALAGGATTLGLSQPGSSGVTAGTAAFGGSLDSRIIATLEDMDDETRAGSRDLTSVYEQTRDEGPLETLQTFAQDQRGDLATVLPSLSPDASERALLSIYLVEQVGGQVSDLLATGACTEACGPGSPVPGDPTGGNGEDGTEACTCPTTPGPTGGADGTGDPDPQRTPEPGKTPDPRPTDGSDPSSPPSGQPEPTPTSLEGQLGGIISDLPLPVTPPPLPDLPGPDLPPLPLPTIRLPH